MVTDRDARIVEWAGRIGAVGAEHLMQRFGMSDQMVYRRLSILVDDGLVEFRRVLYGWPGVYSATMLGLRWQGLGRLGVFRATPATFEHAWQTASVATALYRDLPGWRVVGEREIKALEIEHGELFASANAGPIGSGTMVHRPDLALVSPLGRVVAVEVERTIKERPRLRKICRGWARARHVSHVYYLASPSAGRAVRRALDAVRATDCVTVLDLEDVAALVARERVREEAHLVERTAALARGEELRLAREIPEFGKPTCSRGPRGLSIKEGQRVRPV